MDVADRISVFSDISELRKRVESLLAEGERRIGVRLTDAPYLGSRSIAVLIGCNELVIDEGGIFAIIGPTRQVSDLLSSLGIEDRFVVCETEGELPR